MTLEAPPRFTTGAVAAPADIAAKQLEAFFLRRLLAEARPQGGGMLDGGFAGDTFKQMLDEAVADRVAAAGGLGMADVFAAQLAGRGTHELRGMPPAAPTTHAPAFAPPVTGRAISGYGPRVDPIHGARGMHAGIDLAAATGTPVVAATGGTVVHAGPAGTYGNLVTVRHADGFETRYAHLHAITVAKGDHVIPGQQLGNVGSTGRSTGPHLHFEIRRHGAAIDPGALLPLNRSSNRTKP